MTVTVYRSTDAGAPTLNSVAGSLGNIFDACLVTGYGSKPSAGWTKPYSATNRNAYQMPAGTTGHYLYLDETGATGQYAYMRGYETMSAVGVGFNPFPGPAQNTTALLGYLTILKSDQASGSTVARPWVLVTNGSMLYFWVGSSGTQPIIGTTNCHGFAFGQFISKVPNDACNTILIGNTTVGAVNPTLGTLGANASSGPVPGHYVARGWNQTGSSFPINKITDGAFMTSTVMGTSGAGLAFPNPADGKFYIAPVHILELNSNQTVWRGTLPGFYCPLFSAVNVLNDGDVITDIDGYPGKTFEAKFLYNSMVVLFETSNTW